MQAEINRRVDKLTLRFNELKGLLAEYRAVKLAEGKAGAKSIKVKLSVLKRSIHVDLRSWGKYCNMVLSSKHVVIGSNR